MDEKNLNQNPLGSSPNPPTSQSELPDLSPQTPMNPPLHTNGFAVTDPNLKPLEAIIPPTSPVNGPVAAPIAQVPNQSPSTSSPQPPTPIPAYQPAPSEPQVFVNPNPPTPAVVSTLGQLTNEPDIPAGNNKTNRLGTLPLNKGVIISIIALVLLGGISAFILNEFVLNKISTLKLISQDAEFYLTLSVKKNPQAEKAKATIKKFPGGERILKEFDKYYARLGGSDPKNPLSDITQYAETELLLARQSRATSSKDYSNRLLTIVDLKSNKDAADNITNFEDDKTTYKVGTADYKGNKIYDIKLKSEQSIYEKSLGRSGSIKSNLSTPKPQSVFATNIDKYILASDQEADVKSAINLSQTKKIFGFSGSSEPKSILDSKDHHQLSPFFSKDTFLKFFQREPITPYNTTVPFYSSSVATAPNSAETETKSYQKIARAVEATFIDNGVKINTFSQEIALENKLSPDTFKLDQSLASKLPKQYSGVAPTLYSETKNIEGQWQKHLKIADSLKNSKNRNQRKEFEDYLENLDKMKKSYKDAYGIDYESDVLSWLDGQVAFIVNAGKNKKGPEFILVSETGNKAKAETAFKNFRIPDYSIEARDTTRKRDLSKINLALEHYYSENSNYPDSLPSLVTSESFYGSFYLSSLPNDPKTGASYTYTLSSDKKSYTLSTTLENSQTITYTNKSSVPKTTGEAKETKLTATESKYKDAKIYTMKIYEFDKIKYYLYGAINDHKAIIAVSDSDQSLKEIVDFEASPGQALTKNTNWKKQFDKISDPVTSVGFIEPINLWGFMDYLKEAYPQYKETAESYSADAGKYWDDMEKVVKGYLNTIPSIGSIELAKNDVDTTKTFVNIEELSAKDKKEAEDALGRLLKTDESNQYKSVLGIDSESTSDKAKKEWDKFYNNNLKSIIDPQSILAN